MLGRGEQSEEAPVLTVQPVQEAVQPVQTVQPVQEAVQPVQTVQPVQPVQEAVQLVQEAVQPVQIVQPVQQAVQCNVPSISMLTQCNARCCPSLQALLASLQIVFS